VGIDAKKLHSSVPLFLRAAPAEPVFGQRLPGHAHLGAKGDGPVPSPHFGVVIADP
jgi:hypothetical protein